MTYLTITYDLDDTTAILTLNRPEKMNTWNGTVAAELGQALLEANEDDNVRAVVITGAGRAFCAGADLEGGEGTFAGRDKKDASEEDETIGALQPYQINKPVIAAINGAAVGVGMTYPMLCDIRYAAEDAKMGFVFTRRGMMPELAAHVLVQKAAGFSNAADVLLSGRIFRGKEAAQMGLVSEALPADQVLDRALQHAAEYRLTAPVSVAITKKLLWEGISDSVPEMLAKEGPLFAWVGNQEDAKEGIKSFVEKRDPQWKLSASKDLPDLI